MNKGLYVVGAVAVVGVLGATAWWWHQSASPPPQPPVTAAAPAPAAPASVEPTPAASAPAILHPIPSPVASTETPPAPASVDDMLTELFGRKAVQSMFQLTDFQRRFVATVDNLGRSHAPTILWPLNPAQGQFTVRADGQDTVIEPDNGLRYTSHVLMLETVNLHQAAAAYAQMYPGFQQAYEDLGFPKKYFNDRLVQVLDLLLATPEPDGPVKVHLPAIQGPLQPKRPWVLYEFDDPALNALTSGQRILIRMGPVNERRVKARLAEFRRLVTATAPPR